MIYGETGRDFCLYTSQAGAITGTAWRPPRHLQGSALALALSLSLSL